MHGRASRSRRCLTLGAATLLLAVGCSGATPRQTPTTDDVSQPHPVTIVAEDFEYTEAPSEIPAGIVDLTFENRGAVGHEVAMAGIGDTPIDRFVEDLRGGAFQLNGKPQPAYLDQVIVPPGPAPGETIEATFSMTEGRYAFFCVFNEAPPGEKKIPHYELGMIREVTVVDGDPDPRFGAADGTITAMDYGFDVDLEAGDRVLNFTNDGPNEIHTTTVQVYPKGVSAEEAEAAFTLQLEGRGADLPSPKDDIGSTGILSAGLGSTFRLEQELRSGRTYLFVCFIQDRGGGEPHAIRYRMYRAVTIE